jgi:ABC-type nickel/cobalt efflux system permease component RcnA
MTSTFKYARQVKEVHAVQALRTMPSSAWCVEENVMLVAPRLSTWVLRCSFINARSHTQHTHTHTHTHTYTTTHGHTHSHTDTIGAEERGV